MLVATAIIIPLCAAVGAYLFVAHRRHRQEAYYNDYMAHMESTQRALQATQMKRAKPSDADLRTLPCDYLERE